MAGRQAFILLLEGHVEEAPCLLKLLVGPCVWHVRDVTETARRSHHVVSLPREAQHVGSPRAAIVVTLGDLLSLHLLPSLDLCAVGIKVGLLGLEALGLLLEVSGTTSWA